MLGRNDLESSLQACNYAKGVTVDPQQDVDQSEGEMTHSIDTEEGTSIHSIDNTDSIDEVDGDGRGSVGVAQEEEGDDIVTFEEFKSKMNQEVVINKPPQGQ